MTQKRLFLRLAAACSAAIFAFGTNTTDGDVSASGVMFAVAHAGDHHKAKKVVAPPKPVKKDVVVSDNARKLFRLGVSLLEDADGARNEEAYRAFKAAYADSPSPKILGNLGLCAMRLERDQEAIDAWSKYLTGVPDAPEGFRAQVEKDLQTLKAGVSKVTLKLSHSGASLLDERVTNSGKRIVNRYGPFKSTEATVGIRAGHHRLTFTLEGYDDEVMELDAAPGGASEREVQLNKPTQKPDPNVLPKPGGSDSAGGGFPAGVWVGVGVTGALAIGTAVTGVLALSKGSDFTDANTGADPVAAEALRDEASTLNLTTDILLGATVASAVVTTVLFVMLPPSAPDDDAAEKPVTAIGPLRLDSVGVAPLLAPRSGAAGAALTVGGHF